MYDISTVMFKILTEMFLRFEIPTEMLETLCKNLEIFTRIFEILSETCDILTKPRFQPISWKFSLNFESFDKNVQDFG